MEGGCWELDCKLACGSVEVMVGDWDVFVKLLTLDEGSVKQAGWCWALHAGRRLNAGHRNSSPLLFGQEASTMRACNANTIQNNTHRAVIFAELHLIASQNATNL